jgi:DNA-binding GntR family transcriptional regulator
MLEEHGEWEYLEYGPPPYSVTIIAEQIGGSRTSIARTLRTMAQDGQVVAVRHRDKVWNTIAQGDIETTVTAYYSARTIAEDMTIAKAWHDDAEARSLRALEEM